MSKKTAAQYSHVCTEQSAQWKFKCTYKTAILEPMDVDQRLLCFAARMSGVFREKVILEERFEKSEKKELNLCNIMDESWNICGICSTHFCVVDAF